MALLSAALNHNSGRKSLFKSELARLFSYPARARAINDGAGTAAPMADESGARGLTLMVAGLLAKRQEIAAKIESIQGQVKAATISLDRIEATMRISKAKSPGLCLPQYEHQKRH